MIDLTSRIIAYEMGELDDTETLELFAELIRTGMAWALQGSYGRTAKCLIESGVVSKDGVLNDA
jgi:hypothetical protein